MTHSTPSRRSRDRFASRVIDRGLRIGPGALLRHRAPIFVLGNQKSGTTAIAALVAERADISATLDLRRELSQPTFDQVASGRMGFSRFIAHNWKDFRRELIKEPNLTVLWPQLRPYFPNARYVYIVRDPRDNIRSILNRLKLPGDLAELSREQFEAIPRVWQPTIDGRCIPESHGNYVERLAQRWNWFNDYYFKFSSSTVLVRYEDFTSEKFSKISEIAEALGLGHRADISHVIDRQYQRRGDRSVDLGRFFGPNLRCIEKICEHHMRGLGYLAETRNTEKRRPNADEDCR